jgi:hypothetical protein
MRAGIPLLFVAKGRTMEMVYPRPDTSKCYWLYVRDCLKGHPPCARRKCSDYLTIAKAKKLKRR